MSEKDCFTLNSIAPDVLRKIAGRLYVLADAIEAGTARYLQGAMWIDTKATSFEGPTADGRLRQLAGIERHGFPQGTVTIRSDIEFLTGRPVPPNNQVERP